jgi:short-subunit dehydrogenase involved in D-alanine esterification of teichoic acids
MSASTVDYIDTTLITGGGGGIGKAIAQFLISRGKKVIIAGRTESKLQETAKEIGATAYYVIDTGDIPSISSFIEKITKEHPELNCLINNAGVQRPFEFPGSGGKDYGFDLAKADQEININIRGPMHLVVGLLPHFTSLPDGKRGVIINVSSILGFNPFSVINPVYNGTKAWVHFFTTNLRTQFEKGPQKDRVKIVEIVPPQVATDLHRERTDPDDNKPEKSKTTMTVDAFMEEVAKGLDDGINTITAGAGHTAVDSWEESMGSKYRSMVGS